MAQVRATFKPNRPGMTRFLLSERVQKVSHEAAEDVIDGAVANSGGRAEPGDYEIDHGVGAEQAEGGIRRISEISTDHPGLIALELGTRNKDGSVRIKAQWFLDDAAEPYRTPEDAAAVVAMSRAASKG
jgi:hypothetical protein